MICNKKLISKTPHYRTTSKRILILQEIRDTCSHPTVQELHALVIKKDSSIHLTTVYRALHFLEKQNLIFRIQTKDQETRYDGNMKKHSHLHCTQCKSIQDIFDIPSLSFSSLEIDTSGFQVHSLQLQGLCKHCNS